MFCKSGIRPLERDTDLRPQHWTVATTVYFRRELQKTFYFLGAKSAWWGGLVAVFGHKSAPTSIFRTELNWTEHWKELGNVFEATPQAPQSWTGTERPRSRQKFFWQLCAVKTTRLRSASDVSRGRGTIPAFAALHRAAAPAPAERRAAIDPYLLPATHSAANAPKQHAVGELWHRQTDGRQTVTYTCSAYYAGSANKRTYLLTYLLNGGMPLPKYFFIFGCNSSNRLLQALINFIEWSTECWRTAV